MGWVRGAMVSPGHTRSSVDEEADGLDVAFLGVDRLLPGGPCAIMGRWPRWPSVLIRSAGGAGSARVLMAFRISMTSDAETQLQALPVRDQRILSAAILVRLRDQPTT